MIWRKMVMARIKRPDPHNLLDIGKLFSSSNKTGLSFRQIRKKRLLLLAFMARQDNSCNPFLPLNHQLSSGRRPLQAHSLVSMANRTSAELDLVCISGDLLDRPGVPAERRVDVGGYCFDLQRQQSGSGEPVPRISASALGACGTLVRSRKQSSIDQFYRFIYRPSF
jgi:hypothetical protein